MTGNTTQTATPMRGEVHYNFNSTAVFIEALEKANDPKMVTRAIGCLSEKFSGVSPLPGCKVALASSFLINQNAEAMELLAKDPEILVRETIALNAALIDAPAAIEILARDQDTLVRMMLAHNEALSASPKAIEILARDPEQKVRTLLAQNTALSSNPEAIHILAQDRDLSVVLSLAQDNALAVTPDVMTEFATSKKNWVREGIAHNSALAQHPALVNVLAHDEDHNVLEILCDNPALSASPEAIEALLQHPELEARLRARFASTENDRIRSLFEESPKLKPLPDASAYSDFAVPAV